MLPGDEIINKLLIFELCAYAVRLKQDSVSISLLESVIVISYRFLKVSNHQTNLRRLWITGEYIDTFDFYLFVFNVVYISHMSPVFSPNHGHNLRKIHSKSSILRFTGGLHAMTSGGNASSLQRESLTREGVFGIAWLICLRSFVPAQLSVPCLYPFSAAHPIRLLRYSLLLTSVQSLRLLHFPDIVISVRGPSRLEITMSLTHPVKSSTNLSGLVS